MPHRNRRAYLATLGAVTIAGCLDSLGGGGNGTTDGADGAESDDEPGGATITEDAPTGPPIDDRRLPLPDETGVLADAIVSGGVSQDGIPSIDDPQFLDADEGDMWLGDGEPIFGVAIDGDVRAYPQRVLVWHEIVNDVIGGDPLAVTYCPLTGTAQAFERGETEFGVSGRLLNSNLVMYDRATDSFWPQMLATAIRGPHEGDVLRERSVTWTSWEHWRDAHPETVVLSTETGYARNYDSDPYGSYDPREGFYADDSLLFEPYSPVDDSTLDLKDVVLGARSEDGSLAVSKDALAIDEFIETDLGGVAYIAAWDPRLDTGYVYRNPDEQPLDYENGEVLVDGDAHDPADLPLERVLRYDAFWFAWSGYYPETEIIG